MKCSGSISIFTIVPPQIGVLMMVQVGDPLREFNAESHQGVHPIMGLYCCTSQNVHAKMVFARCLSHDKIKIGILFSD